MADKLIFPIGFDLEAAVKNAEKEGVVAIERLNKVFSRQPLIVKADAKGFAELEQSTKTLEARLKAIQKQWADMPTSAKFDLDSDGKVKQLTADGKALWDELNRIIVALQGVGQGISQFAKANQRELEAEAKVAEKAALAQEKLAKMKLQKEWNAAADQHRKDQLAEENRLQQETVKIKREAEAIAKREAEIEKLIVEYKLRQVQAEQAKKKASDEDYANLVKQLREEERLSAEKARQKALDIRRQNQAEATAAIERERNARRQLFEAKRQQWQEEQKAISSQTMSYDALMAKLRAWQNIQNRSEVGSKRWEEASRAIRETKDMLALVTEEMNKSAKAAERIRQLREILSANERTLAGLNTKLAEYNSRIQGLEVGSNKFNNTALQIRRLTDELERANQRMRDFQQTAFKGLSDSFTTQQVAKLTQLREAVAAIDRDINRINQAGGGRTADGQFSGDMKVLLESRMNLTREINNMLKSGYDLQLEREKQISQIQEQRKAKADAIAAKKRAETQAAQANIAKLKEERRILNQQESSVAAITAKLQVMQQRLNTANMKSGQFEQIAKEVQRLTEKLERAKAKIAELTGQTVSGANKQASSVNKVSQEFKKQDTYVSRLIKRLAVYAGFQQISSFLTNVREVTAEFELQRVSLGAILQDQTKANQLFSEIKQFALKSPVKILDLTKYTKQLAAYKIGYDELFETTKKLTDVSVGLGVSMDRVVLAYGQVRATGYLRASEIRQFTEMGVPIVEELASKLTKMNGELVTAAQVMDMVSKRGISFELVKEVFDDLTSAGGAFYNMQEKQGNTLYGMWAKLGDAASVMYEQIGNTGWVNSSMKGMINSLTDLMRNWKEVSRYIGVAGVALISYMLTSKLGTASTVMAAKATRDYTRAQVQLNTAKAQGSKMSVIAATASARAAAANRAAAMSTNVWTAAKYRLIAATNNLKAALATNWITVAITAILALANAIYTAWENSHRLGNALGEIKSEMTTLQTQSVRNFEYLANNAVKAAKGSKEQREALEELNRTYKDILPQEALKLENLAKLNGHYDSLTKAVKEYIAVQQEEKAINEIREEYGKKTTQDEKMLREIFKKGFDMSDTDIDRFFVQFKKLSAEASLTLEQKVTKAFDNIGKKLTSSEKKDLFETTFGIKTGTYALLDDLNNAMVEQEGRINAVRKEYKLAAGDLGEFGIKLEETKEKLANIKYTNPNGTPMETDSMLYQQSVSNDTMKAAYNLIIDEVNELNKELLAAGLPLFKFLEGDWTHYVENVDPKNLMDITTINFDAILEAIGDKYPEFKMRIKAIQDEWGNVAPTNATAMQIRTKLVQLSQSFDPALQKMKKYLWDGSGEVDAYLKRLKGQQEELRARLKEKQESLKNMSLISKWWNKLLGKDIQAEIDQMNKELAALDSFVPFVQGYVPEEKKDKKKSGGSKSDTRLQTLQEINQTLEKINKEYDDLQKKEGKTKALEDIKKQFKETLEYTNKLGAKFGLHFDFPTEFKSLQQYRNEILEVMKTLKNLKGGEKAILEFQTMIDKADSDELQKQLEKKLKDLADRISRTKTAKEFYDKILGQTGDIELAAHVTLSLYGDTGEGLFDATVKQIQEIFKSNNPDVKIDLSSVIDTTNQRINYGALAKLYEQYQDVISEANRSTAEKIISEGQKVAAANVTTWEKELAKAKDFEQQRTDIINRETQRRAEIIKSHEYTPEQKEEKIAQSERIQREEIYKIDVEEFKAGDDYIKIFQDVENVATSSLDRIETELKNLIANGKNLDATNLKTYVDALEKIQDEKEKRDPLKAITNGVRDYIDAIRERKQAETELKAAKADYETQMPMVQTEIDVASKNKETADEDVVAAQQQLLLIQQEMSALRAQEVVDSTALAALRAQEIAAENKLVSAKLRQNIAATTLTNAENKRVSLTKKLQTSQKKLTNAQDKQKKAVKSVADGLNQANENVGSMADALSAVKELLGDAAADGTVLGGAIDGGIQALETFQKLMAVIIALQTVYNIVTESNPWIAIAAAVLAVAGILAGAISAAKVAKANKEIERQQELLENLEYAYERLEKAADKAFGKDYTSNIRQQKETLEAEIEARKKQLAAEKSKGKKADKNKKKEYQEAIRDLGDQLAELEGKVGEQMFGTDLTSAARDFAKAWLDAYKEFGSTADAMSEKFHEMIENMVVESLLAKVMENALRPAFKMIDEYEGDFSNPSFWQEVTKLAKEGADNANNGARVMMQFLEQAGMNIRELGGDLTGISKEVASASSEEINANTAALNVQNYYASHLPLISQNVMAIRTLVEQGNALMISRPAVDVTALWNQHLELQQGIYRHTAQTVDECRAIASHCSNIADTLSRVVIPNGATTARASIKVRM
jgi:hypothetical protein